jgi:hypothetical protein
MYSTPSRNRLLSVLDANAYVDRYVAPVVSACLSPSPRGGVDHRVTASGQLLPECTTLGGRRRQSTARALDLDDGGFEQVQDSVRESRLHRLEASLDQIGAALSEAHVVAEVGGDVSPAQQAVMLRVGPRGAPVHGAKAGVSPAGFKAALMSAQKKLAAKEAEVQVSRADAHEAWSTLAEVCAERDALATELVACQAECKALHQRVAAAEAALAQAQAQAAPRKEDSRSPLREGVAPTPGRDSAEARCQVALRRSARLLHAAGRARDGGRGKGDA